MHVTLGKEREVEEKVRESGGEGRGGPGWSAGLFGHGGYDDWLDGSDQTERRGDR